MATTPKVKSLSKKKELKKDLADKMESALPEIKTKLGEKKFQRRIRKAAKILVHGLHNKDLSGNNGNGNNAPETPLKKIKGVKKPKTKKQELVSN